MAFRVALATDPMRLAAYLDDAEAATIAAGLDAAVLPGCESIIRRIVAADLMTTPLSAAYTLCIPPARMPEPDMDAHNRMLALNVVHKESEEG